MRVGIADHFGWAVAVTASADHEVVDRRRIELVEPGMTAAPIHYESQRLDVAATAALVAKVRASVVRATSAALDELATALPAPVVSISLRTWPPDFPDDIAVQRRAPYEARADAIMYRQVLAELAHARGWKVHLYNAKDVDAVRRSACWPSGPTRSCRVLGQRWGRPGRRTIASRSPRRSSAAEIRGPRCGTRQETCSRPSSPSGRVPSGGVARRAPAALPGSVGCPSRAS